MNSFMLFSEDPLCDNSSDLKELTKELEETKIACIKHLANNKR